MNMSVKTVVKVRDTPHGLIAIPKRVRELLDIQPGDYLQLTVEKVDKKHGDPAQPA